MEEMSPAVSFTLRLSNTIVDCPTAGITRLKIVADGSSCNGAKVDGTNEINSEELTSQIRLPIAVEFEGTESGQIVAKVISVEKQSFESISSSPHSIKGGVKSVFELDCVPIWGYVSICGKSQEMEDATMAAPYFMRIPIKMFIGDRVMDDGLSQTLSHLTSHFFGVYDGHGGSQVANYCRKRIHVALAEELKFSKDDLMCDNSSRDVRQLLWERAFRSCFLKVDDEVGGKVGLEDDAAGKSDPIAPDTVGSTAVVAVISSSHIVVANCGDSRAVLYRGKEAMALSIDHKPNRQDECTRSFRWQGYTVEWASRFWCSCNVKGYW